MSASAAEVVSFWQEAGPDRWFNKDTSFDQQIRERFLATYEQAAAGRLSSWEEGAQSALSLPAPSFEVSIARYRRNCVASSTCRLSIPRISPIRNVASHLTRQPEILTTSSGRKFMPTSSAASVGSRIAMPRLAATPQRKSKPFWMAVVSPAEKLVERFCGTLATSFVKLAFNKSPATSRLRCQGDVPCCI